MEEEKTAISQQEYRRLIHGCLRDLRQTARELHEELSLEEAFQQSKELVADFYTVAK